MIKGIIFDFGGVFTKVKKLFRDFAKEFAPIYNIDEEELRKKALDVWFELRTEQNGPKDFWSELCKALQIRRGRLEDDFKRFTGYRVDLHDYVLNNLKGKYKLGLLSNHVRTWLEEVIIEKEFSSLFDSIITSYDIQIAKPNKAIYLISLMQLTLKAEETVYVDDMEENVEMAREIGMKGILFKDFESFKKELETLLKTE